jgi:hypothetical protein
MSDHVFLYSDEFFVRERAVDFGGIEECDAAFHGGPENGDHLLLVLGRTVGKAHSHATEPEGRHFQVAVSKLALLHGFSCQVWRELLRIGKMHFDGDAIRHTGLEPWLHRLWLAGLRATPQIAGAA